MKVVINATNLGIGGGVVHLKEFITRALEFSDKHSYIVFAQNKILCQLPEHSRLTKKAHPLLEKSLMHRLIFQLFYFDRLIPYNSIIFSVTGDYLGKYTPVIGMAQNMLLYERQHWRKMTFPEKARFYINYLKQKKCFKNCTALIFNSKYSQDYINREFSFIANKIQRIIHHGVSDRFQFPVKKQLSIKDYSKERPFIFNYISTIHTYKNHPQVVKAFGELKEEGYPLLLNLVGAIINPTAGRELKYALEKYDPDGICIKYHGFVDYELLTQFYRECDGVLYASSCETMPITVMESMLSGRPLVCSSSGPIPEFVKDHAFYFDPEKVESIKSAIKDFLLSPLQREKNALNAQVEAQKYQWDLTTQQTLDYIDQIFKKHYGSV
jgi:glycosyltransferase involved in cell wall biosynthesis